MKKRRSPERELEDLELEFHRKMSRSGKDVFSMKKLFSDPRTERLLRSRESLLPTGRSVAKLRRFPESVTANDILRGPKR